MADVMLSINDCCGCLGYMSSVGSGFMLGVADVCG